MLKREKDAERDDNNNTNPNQPFLTSKLYQNKNYTYGQSVKLRQLNLHHVTPLTHYRR